MKKYFSLLILLISILFFHNLYAADQHPKIIVIKLDWKVITLNLPLKEHQKLKSGTGKFKQLWKIKGQEVSHFEVIGNNQNDADNIGWNCTEFDKQGNTIQHINPLSFCHQFFVKVLHNVVDKPELLANELLIKAEKIHPQTAIEKFGDISIETDGDFYFLRRISRM